MLLKGVYGDFPHHNDGSHLDGGVTNDAIWWRRWRQLAAQSASWYAMPYGAVGRRFMTILATEWKGVPIKSWNSDMPLVFAHIILTKTLGVCSAKDIRSQITRRMDLWERGLHAGLVGDAEVEGAARECRAAIGEEEED